MVNVIRKECLYEFTDIFLNDLSDHMSYAVWCFIRGYDTDVLAREIPKEEAVRKKGISSTPCAEVIKED